MQSAEFNAIRNAFRKSPIWFTDLEIDDSIAIRYFTNKLQTYPSVIYMKTEKMDNARTNHQQYTTLSYIKIDTFYNLNRYMPKMQLKIDPLNIDKTDSEELKIWLNNSQDFVFRGKTYKPIILTSPSGGIIKYILDNFNVNLFILFYSGTYNSSNYATNTDLLYAVNTSRAFVVDCSRYRILQEGEISKLNPKLGLANDSMNIVPLEFWFNLKQTNPQHYNLLTTYKLLFNGSNLKNPSKAFDLIVSEFKGKSKPYISAENGVLLDNLYSDNKLDELVNMLKFETTIVFEKYENGNILQRTAPFHEAIPNGNFRKKMLQLDNQVRGLEGTSIYFQGPVCDIFVPMFLTIPEDFIEVEFGELQFDEKLRCTNVVQSQTINSLSWQIKFNVLYVDNKFAPFLEEFKRLYQQMLSK